MKSLPAGRLRERVTLQERNVTDNGRGGRRAPVGEQPWRDVVRDIAAEVIALRGDEALTLGVQRSTQLYKVTIRARSGVTTAHRLMWMGIALNIRTAPPSMRSRGADLVMTCESGVAT